MTTYRSCFSWAAARGRRRDLQDSAPIGRAEACVALASALGPSATWSHAELAALANAGDEVYVAAGQLIHPFGSAFSWAYLILSGTAVETSSHGEVVGGVGTVFGATTDVDDQRVTLCALTDVQVLVIGRRELFALYERYPNLASRPGARGRPDAHRASTAAPAAPTEMGPERWSTIPAILGATSRVVATRGSSVWPDATAARS